MSRPTIDLKRIRELAQFAEKLGFRVIHVHADVLRPGEPPCVKIRLQDRGKK